MGRSEWRFRFALILVQLGAALLMVAAFRIETRSFFNVLLLAFAGFVASALLPARHRMALLAALSVLSVWVGLGIDAGSTVLAVGGLLIVTCHLPIAMRWRIGLILAVAAGLAMQRSNLDNPVVVPILASMFMFRLMLYLYELRHAPDRATPVSAIAYFFMLPNACLPLFPVVDYDTFRRSGTAPEEEIATYERGVQWIFRGLVQLLLRRLVMEVDDLSVNDLGDMLQYLVMGFLAYLEVSGAFHLVVGVLHLFGLRLPETHHRYWLASSVTDFWRRINIYWKDLMMKLVFYPSYFRLRGAGATRALVLSTVAVFVATWGLHSYQQFWLVGTPRLSWQDALFWGAFGALVVGVTVRDARERPARRPGGRWDARRASSTVGTMCLVLVLWSFWEAQSVGSWFYAWRQVRFSTPLEWLLVILFLLGLVAVAGYDWDGPLRDLRRSRMPLRQAIGQAALRIGLASAFAGMTSAAILPTFPAEVRMGIRLLRTNATKPRDVQIRFLGYYDGLMNQPVGGWTPWIPPDEELWQGVDFGLQNTDDFLLHRLRAGFEGDVEGVHVSVNRWGMRDRDYELRKPDSVFRIVVIGPSYVMGWGVEQDDMLDAVLERALDSIASHTAHGVEVMNVSATSWIPAQEVYAFKTLAAPFRPDLVLLAADPHWLDRASNVQRFASAAIPVADSTLAALVAQAGVTADQDIPTVGARLRLVESGWHRRVASWTVEIADSVGSKVAVLGMRLPKNLNASGLRPVRRAYEAAGVPWLDCTNAYLGYDEGELAVSGNDDHPNATGHRLLAQCIENQLRDHPRLLPAWLRSSP